MRCSRHLATTRKVTYATSWQNAPPSLQRCRRNTSPVFLATEWQDDAVFCHRVAKLGSILPSHGKAVVYARQFATRWQNEAMDCHHVAKCTCIIEVNGRPAPRLNLGKDRQDFRKKIKSPPTICFCLSERSFDAAISLTVLGQRSNIRLSDGVKKTKTLTC